MSRATVMFSVAQESYAPAVAELREAFGAALKVTRLGPDFGVLTEPAPDLPAVAAACRERPLVFLRHLSIERARVATPAAANLDAVSAAAAAVLADGPAPGPMALQCWVSGEPRLGYRAGELAARVWQELTAAGYQLARAGQPQVLSCCVTASGVSIGFAPTSQSLSDWPGGRVRLSRSAAQVSRAEFKLEELFTLFPEAAATTGRAVDLGASPGGWTRILRQRGLTVHAVDPAELDPRVARDPGVTHVRTTAGEFFRATDLRFGLVANDMRMDPLRSCRVILDAVPSLRGGGLAIVTLKLDGRSPGRTVQSCLALLRPEFDIRFARQLHHNRHEVTVVGRRR